MKSNIGVDLHTNSFTICRLRKGEEEVIRTFSVRKMQIDRFIAIPGEKDEVALELTGNSAWFRKQLLPHVAKVVVSPRESSR